MIPYLRKIIAQLSSSNDMKILIDNGHGLNTSGKRSPDGTFREAIYNREIARRMSSWSGFMSKPPETARNGSMLTDGVSIHAKDKQSLIDSLTVFARQQSRTSQVVSSEPTCQTVIWTGSKGSTCSGNRFV